jgi:alpha-L-fucosidase
MRISVRIVLVTLGLMNWAQPVCVAQTSKGTAPTPLLPVPTKQQMAWHQMELSGFIHFTINTFTDKEWGYGNESPSLFDPADVNVEQWVRR